MRNAIILSLRALRRDWRSGELRILLLALVIAVGGLTAVSFFIDRVEQAMREQASELLAADLAIRSSEPVPAHRAARARDGGLQTARTLSFRSIAMAGEKMQLVELKAVSDAYPLRGRLRIAREPFAPDAVTRSTPAAGEVWVNASLLQALNIGVGEAVKLGRAGFRVAQVLTYEPDRGGDLFSIAPRLLMNIGDVPATGLVQRGSRVRYKLLVAGESVDIRRFQRWLTPRLGINERVITLEEGRPELRAALERAQQFLGLAALVSVLLAGVAIAVAARRYAQRHLDTSAIMRCLGATQRTVVGIFAWEMIWLGLVASLIGCAVGYAAHVALAEILTGFVAGLLPAPSPRPLLVGVAAGMVILMGFALPPLLALRHVPPTRVLRRDLGAVSPTSVFTFFAALAAMISLMAWQARDLTLFTWALGGTLATLLVLSLVALILVRLMNRLRGKVGVAWRFGLANIARRARGSVVQIVAFGVGVMVLLLLSIVRTDLLDGWRRTIPVNAPNHFLINVQPDQVTRLQTFLSAHGIVSPTLYPMVRARLVEINGEPVSPRRFSDAHARRHVMREFNLSWAARLRGDNHVVAGRWWIPAEHGQPLISFEQRLAETLEIRVGDRLKYNVADTELELRVINLRAVDWDTFNVNFFTILPPGVLDGFPATYVTSFYLPAGAGSMLPSLVKTFPNVTVIDVDALMTKVRLIMERVSVAIEYVFLFTLVAGLAVLYAALQATQDERRYESAILRTLGARQHQLFRSLLAEFATLGMLAGLLAGFAATLLGYILAEHVFHIPYQLNPWIWLLGWIGGTVGISIAGTLGTRRVLHQPPLKTLREV